MSDSDDIEKGQSSAESPDSSELNADINDGSGSKTSLVHKSESTNPMIVSELYPAVQQSTNSIVNEELIDNEAEEMEEPVKTEDLDEFGEGVEDFDKKMNERKKINNFSKHSEDEKTNLHVYQSKGTEKKLEDEEEEASEHIHLEDSQELNRDYNPDINTRNNMMYSTGFKNPSGTREYGVFKQDDDIRSQSPHKNEDLELGGNQVGAPYSEDRINQPNEEEIHRNLLDDDSDEENQNEDPDTLIKMVNVHKTYLMGLEGVQALRGVNLTVKKGEFVIILGTSGGGKTTMLNIIGTIDKPTKGDLWLCGERVTSNTNDKLLASLRLNKVAFVFQSFNLIGSLTAKENVELPMQLKGGLSRSKLKGRAEELLKKVDLGDRLDHFPNQLSGGEQQRVTISRALSNKPTILLLDEPTGDLDTRSSDIVMKIIMDLNLNDKITMVMVTHDTALRKFASKIVRMSDGKIGSIEEIKDEERMRNYNKLKKRVDNIEKGIDKGKLNVRQGIEAYDNQDDEEDLDEGEGEDSEEEKQPRTAINDEDEDEEKEKEDPGEKRNVPTRMAEFVNQENRTSKTSVRMPWDYPFIKKEQYLKQK
mmetsp:Transcript_23018/g.25570  ORF Transcript_23018/g.25570 Transcript_23018/m.25570 type:complete len:591 (+) Transcript_23018:21-1793(+)